MIEKQKEKQKGLGFFSLTAVVVGTTIGGGVFSMSGDMAASGAGTCAVLIGWLIAGLGMLALTMCFFQLNRVRPELTGGIYSYAAAGFGDYVGFNSAWGFWISTLLTNVSYATLLFSAFGHFFSFFDDGNNLISILCASLLVWILVILVALGIKGAAFINLIVTLAKLIPIALFIVAIPLASKFHVNIFIDHFFGEPGGLSLAAQIKSTTFATVWAFIGVEGAVVVSGRAAKSGDVGKATLTAFLLVLAIYVIVSILSMGVMTREELATLGNPPLAGILKAAVGSWGAVVVNIGVIVSLLGAMLGHTIIAAECPYEAAKQGSFANIFSKENKKAAPIFSLLITNLIAQAFLIIIYFNASTYQTFYSISASMIMFPYLLSAMYYWKLLRKERQLRTVQKRRSVHLLIAVTGTIYGVWLLYAGGLTNLLITAILYAPGTLVYIKGKREMGESPFHNLRDIFILILIVVTFILSIIWIKNGTIKPF